MRPSFRFNTFQRPHAWWVALACCTLTVLSFSLPACQVLYMAFGGGTVEPLFKLAPGRTLVLVDSRPNTTLYLVEPDLLAKQINDHLFTYKAIKDTDQLVPEYRVAELRKNPAAFRNMSIADIAKKLDADAVIHVDVPQFQVVEEADSNVSHGQAQAVVKVLDKNGRRLWPTDGRPGATVAEAVNYSDENAARITAKLIEKLSFDIGKIFHPYARDDPHFITSPD